MIPKNDQKTLITKPSLKCAHCHSRKFVYGDHASVEITIGLDGQVEYGETTYAGEVEYIRCANCGRELPKEIKSKLIW